MLQKTTFIFNIPLTLLENFNPSSASSMPAIICSALEQRYTSASVKLILLNPLSNNFKPNSSSNFEICCDKEGCAKPSILEAFV